MTMPDAAAVPVAERHENIILCGFMGTGKTTVGKIVAARLGWQVLDTDHIIEEQVGHPISKIFAVHGESAFRQMEADVCERLALVKHKVIATGGGIVLREDNREALVDVGLVVCLDAPAEIISARLSSATDRPLIAGADPTQRIAELLSVRAPAYAALPYHVNVASGTPQEIAEEIVVLWARTQR